MGRKSLNRTYDELLAIKNKKAKEYYHMNKEIISKKRKDKYKLLKENFLRKTNNI